jgi:hypothetical protein
MLEHMTQEYLYASLATLLVSPATDPQKAIASLVPSLP